jgi:hypothetical protein
VLNVCENVPPGLMHEPVGHDGLESNAPVSEVTLWIDWPVFVQTTVVPAVTVIDDGKKPKSTIETCAEAAGDGVGAPVVSGVNGSGIDAVVVCGAGTTVVVGAGRAVNAVVACVPAVATVAGAIARRNAPTHAAPPANVTRRLRPVVIGVGIRTAPAIRSRLPA